MYWPGIACALAAEAGRGDPESASAASTIVATSNIGKVRPESRRIGFAPNEPHLTEALPKIALVGVSKHRVANVSSLKAKLSVPIDQVNRQRSSLVKDESP